MPRNLFRTLLAAALPALFASSAAAAQADPGVAEILAFRLTAPGMSAYTQAVRSLASLPEQELRSLQEASQGQASLDATVAVFEVRPAVAGAVQRSGLSIRDFLLFSIALQQAGALVAVPAEALAALPPVQRENLAFFRGHEAELRRLAQELEALSRAGAPAQ